MRRLFGAAVLAAGVFAGGAAIAQNWVQVASDGGKNSWDVDITSVRPNGANVESWVRFTIKGGKWDARNNRYYATALTHRLDNCAAQTTASMAGEELDSHGKVVVHVETPADKLVFTATPPDSVDRRLQDQICGFARQQASLVPALDVGPTSPLPWTQFGADAKVTYAYARIQRGENSSVFLERTQGAQGPGGAYQSLYNVVVVDCVRLQFRIIATDGYDAGNRLIFTVKKPFEQAEISAIHPGSIISAVTGPVCTPPAAASADAQAGAADGAPGDVGAPGQPQLATGTGWMVAGGYLITADHVVHGAHRIWLGQEGAPVGVAEIVAEDEANDIAVLRPTFKTGHYAPIALRLRGAVLGEPVFTLGYPAPDAMGFSVKVNSGEISALTGVGDHGADDRRYEQISAPVQPGNSGGPVLDAGGQAVGMVIARIEDLGDGHAAQNVNYALKSLYLRAMLDGLPPLSAEPAEPLPRAREAMIARLRASVLMVVVELSK